MESPHNTASKRRIVFAKTHPEKFGLSMYCMCLHVDSPLAVSALDPQAPDCLSVRVDRG